MAGEKIPEKEVVDKVKKEVTAADILAFRNVVPIEKCNLSEIGVVYIYGFTGVEKNQWLKKVTNEDGTLKLGKVDTAMLVMCVRNKAGQRLFKEADILKLEELPVTILNKLTKACNKVNGVGREAEEVILRNFR